MKSNWAFIRRSKNPERVQRCHRINNLLVNQTATSPEPPSASPSEHIRLQLGSYWRWGGGCITMTDLLHHLTILPNISTATTSSLSHTQTASEIHYLLQLFSLCRAHLVINQHSCQPDIIVDRCQSLSREVWKKQKKTNTTQAFSIMPKTNKRVFTAAQSDISESQHFPLFFPPSASCLSPSRLHQLMFQ